MTNKQNKKESINDWSRRVFGYTKDGYLYVNNKKVSKIDCLESDDEFVEYERLKSKHGRELLMRDRQQPVWIKIHQ